MLRDLFYQEDNLQEEANCRIYESYQEDVGVYPWGPPPSPLSPLFPCLPPPFRPCSLFYQEDKAIPSCFFVSRPSGNRKPTLPAGKKKTNPQKKTNSNIHEKDIKIWRQGVKFSALYWCSQSLNQYTVIQSHLNTCGKLDRDFMWISLFSSWVLFTRVFFLWRLKTIFLFFCFFFSGGWKANLPRTGNKKSSWNGLTYRREITAGYVKATSWRM